MTDLSLAVVVTGEGSGLKAVMRSATGDVKAFGDAGEATAAKMGSAATKIETAWSRAGTSIGNSLSGLTAAASRLGGSMDQIFGRMQATFSRLSVTLNETMTRAAKSFGGMGSMIQNFGFQLGDLSTQIASGGGILRPLIQQGTQFISAFGPWGAIIGAAGASIGALAVAFGALEDPTAKADAALAAYNKTLEHAQELHKGLQGEMKATREAMEADARFTIATMQGQLDAAEQAMKGLPKRIGVRTTSIDNPEYIAAKKARDEVRQQLLILQGTLGVFGDGHDMLGAAAPAGSGGPIKEQKAALDELVSSLQKDAELASLSGKAHAERQAIMQAEAAVLKDVEAGLRKNKDLTAEEKAAVIAAADARYTNADAIKKADEAARDAQQTTKQQQKAIEDATKAINDQIAGYDEELYQLNLSDRERFVRQGLLQAEQAATKANTVVTLEQAEAIRQERGAIFDRNQVISDGKKAQQEATQEAEKAVRERERIAEKEAELQLVPFKNAIQGLQTAWTDGWYNALSGNINTFSEFFASVKQMGLRWAAEMVSLATFRPVAGSVIGSIAPQLASSLGLSGQNAAAAASGGGIFGSIKASAAPLAAMFGGSGGATSGIGSWLSNLFGANSPVMSNGIQVGTSMPGWASFLNSGLGTGAVGALLSAGLTYASGGSALQAGISGGGSLLGSLAGSVFGQPVLGGILGGVAGNIISSLFGKKEKKPPKQQSVTSVEALANGLFGVGDTRTKNSGDRTSGLAGDAANTLNALLASLRATVSGPLSGDLLYYGRTPRPMSSVGGITNQFDDSEQGAKDAIADFIARTMVEAAKSDKLDGVSAAVKQAIANSGATDADALDTAIAFGKFYDRVDKIRTPADAAAAAMADLAAQMAKASSQAEEYGLDVAKIPEIFKENFIDDIEQQILALTDPQQAALNEEEKAAAARIAQAQKLGADLTKVEELNALKRQQVAEQGLAGVTSTFQDFFNGLTTGPLAALSPQEQLRQATMQYETAYQSGDASDFTQAASTLLTIAKDFYASTQGYADLYRQVLTDTKQLGGLSTGLPRGLSSVGSMYGRNGDNQLVHVNDNEVQALFDMGGSGTVNPYTGLLEFAPRADRDQQSNTRPDRAQSAMGGGGASGGSGRADRDQQSNTTPDRAQSAMGGGKDTAGGNGPLSQDERVNLPTPPGIYSSNDADEAAAAALGVSPERYIDAARAFRDRIADYNDTNNSFGEDVANFFASLLGFNEMPASPFDVNNLSPYAKWAWDPAGLVGGAIGMGVGAFGLGTAFDIISGLAGRPFAVPIGDSVFGEPEPEPGSVANDNALNDSLNTQRAAALSAVQSSTLAGLAGGGSFVDTSHLPSNVDGRLAATVAQQSERIAQLDATGQQTTRYQQESLRVLQDIRASQQQAQYYQTLTTVRKKAS